MFILNIGGKPHSEFKYLMNSFDQNMEGHSLPSQPFFISLTQFQSSCPVPEELVHASLIVNHDAVPRGQNIQ